MRYFYPDGVTYEGDNPPAMDIQVIVQQDKDRGWIMTHGADFYIWKDDRWWNCDLYGLFRFLMDTGLVLFGQTIPHSEFEVIYRQAKQYRQDMVDAKSSL